MGTNGPRTGITLTLEGGIMSLLSSLITFFVVVTMGTVAYAFGWKGILPMYLPESFMPYVWAVCVMAVGGVLTWAHLRKESYNPGQYRMCGTKRTESVFDQWNQWMVTDDDDLVDARCPYCKGTIMTDHVGECPYIKKDTIHV